MYDIGVALIMLLVLLIFIAGGFFASYFVIKLAIKHGMYEFTKKMEAEKQNPTLDQLTGNVSLWQQTQQGGMPPQGQ